MSTLSVAGTVLFRTSVGLTSSVSFDMLPLDTRLREHIATNTQHSKHFAVLISVGELMLDCFYDFDRAHRARYKKTRGETFTFSEGRNFPASTSAAERPPENSTNFDPGKSGPIDAVQAPQKKPASISL